MATLTVSNSSELNSAVNSAGSGDTIVLENGNYGGLTLRGASNLTIRAEGGSAVLERLAIQNSRNVTVDGVDFDGATDSGGYGTGTGLNLRSSSGITIRNSEISDYSKGIQVWNVTGLELISNTLDNISYDGMVLGHVRGARISSNDVTMHGRTNVDHKDILQIYNQGSQPPSSDIVISNNRLTAIDSNIHGVYMGNYDANATGSASEFYRNITITGNVIDSQHKLGIAVDRTDGLTITDNVVLQNDRINSSRTINKPVILVNQNADDVRVTGNVVLDTPSASGANWQKASIAGSNWSISGNDVVSTSTRIDSYASGSAGANNNSGGSDSGSDGGSDSGSGGDTGGDTGGSTGGDTGGSTGGDTGGDTGGSTGGDPGGSTGGDTGGDTGGSTGGSTGGDTDTSGLGNGVANQFRYIEPWMNGDTTSRLAGIDFSEGDTLKLGRFDAGTFRDSTSDSNIVHNSKAGDYVLIDSIADIAELVANSAGISASVSGSDLTFSIEQDEGVLDLILPGHAAAYDALV